MCGRWRYGVHERRFCFEDDTIWITDTVKNAGSRTWECDIVRMPFVPGTYCFNGDEIETAMTSEY